MSTEFDDELNEQERRAFIALAREREAPAELEERTVRALRREGLLPAPVTARGGASPRRPLLPRAGLALAASVALFALGVLVGSRWWSQSPQQRMEPAASPEFMLVLRPLPPRAAGEGPGTEGERVREYTAWAREARRAGLVGGEKLKDEARVLRSVGGRLDVVAASDEAAAGSGLSGYFILRARDYDHAVSIARDCPHLKHGGTVEVRQIDRR